MWTRHWRGAPEAWIQSTIASGPAKRGHRPGGARRIIPIPHGRPRRATDCHVPSPGRAIPIGRQASVGVGRVHHFSRLGSCDGFAAPRLAANRPLQTRHSRDVLNPELARPRSAAISVQCDCTPPGARATTDEGGQPRSGTLTRLARSDYCGRGSESGAVGISAHRQFGCGRRARARHALLRVDAQLARVGCTGPDALWLAAVELDWEHRRSARIRTQGGVDDRLALTQLGEGARSDSELANAPGRAAPEVVRAVPVVWLSIAGGLWFP